MIEKLYDIDIIMKNIGGAYEQGMEFGYSLFGV